MRYREIIYDQNFEENLRKLFPNPGEELDFMDDVEVYLSVKPERGKKEFGIWVLNMPRQDMAELYMILYVFDENYVYLLNITKL